MNSRSRALRSLLLVISIGIGGIARADAQTKDAASIAQRVNQLMSLAKQAPRQKGKPANILLVIADDMGVDESHCYDNGRQAKDLAPMPNLSHLCRDGIVFENLWSAPVCSPTRATIMTGRYGFRTGVLAPIPRGAGEGLSTDEFTLARALKEHRPDMAAGIIGKWHISGDTSDPGRMGWDYYAGLFGGGTRSYSSWRKTEQGHTERNTNYTTTEFVDDAIEWVRTQEDKPWFLWLAFNAPHAPFHAPPAHLHSQKNLPEDGGREAWPRYYKAMIEAMDTEFGRLLLALGPETVANTNILFIGDNGTPGQVAKAPVQRRRAKGSLYQGGVHVPFFISGPAVSGGGRRNEDLINTADLFATILELAGADTRKTLPVGLRHDSVSFLPVLQGRSSTGKRDWAYSEVSGESRRGPGRAGRTIRDKDYKLIEFETGRVEFYHLANDPHERQSLATGSLSGADEMAFERLGAAMKRLHAN